MEDNAHMSEKLLLSEQAQESLRVSFMDTAVNWNKKWIFYLSPVCAGWADGWIIFWAMAIRTFYPALEPVSRVVSPDVAGSLRCWVF